MSLLDTFTILFESDTANLRDGLDKTEKNVSDIEQSAQKADVSLAELGKSFLQMAAGYFAVDAAIGSFNETVTELEAIGRTADALGQSVEDVDAFGRAMQAMGGDAQGARDSLVDMAESMGEALQDAESGRAEVYAKLGISLRDANGEAINATEGILRLADAVQGMSQEEAIFRIKELGITDNRTVEMVLKGRKELERMLAVQKEQSGVTEESVENARRYSEAMNAFQNATGAAGQGIVSLILPALTYFIDKLGDIVNWANEHKDLVTGFFIAVAGVIAAVYLPGMIAAAAATLAATWPLIAMGAAVAAVAAAFALAYEDVMAFIDGNDSLIGQIFEKYPAVKDAVFAVIDAFRLMGSAVVAIFSGIADGFSAMLGFVLSGIDKIKSGASSVAGFFGFGGNESVEAGQQAITQANASPLNSTTSNAISNTVASTNRETNVQVGEVIVNTQATDAQGIASDVGGSLNEQLAQVDTEFSTGVAR